MKIILDDGWVGWKEEEEEVFVCDVVERRRMSNKEANWMTYTPTPKKKNFFFFFFLPSFPSIVKVRERMCVRGGVYNTQKNRGKFQISHFFFFLLSLSFILFLIIFPLPRPALYSLVTQFPP